MCLGGEKEGMGAKLAHLHNPPVRGQAGEGHTGGFQRYPVVVVHDAYISVVEALKHGGIPQHATVNIKWLCRRHEAVCTFRPVQY